MQYLLRIRHEGTQDLWRLIAVDGETSIAEVAELMAQAFGYGQGRRSFVLPSGETLDCGADGRATAAAALPGFDSLQLEADSTFGFKAVPAALAQESAGAADSGAGAFVHQVQVMKKDEHLYCLMPSCLVGAGLIPEQLRDDAAAVIDYVQSEEAESLDLRECTKRMRSALAALHHNFAGLEVAFVKN